MLRFDFRTQRNGIYSYITEWSICNIFFLKRRFRFFPCVLLPTCSSLKSLGVALGVSNTAESEVNGLHLALFFSPRLPYYSHR